jgi:hypothetical protein
MNDMNNLNDLINIIVNEKSEDMIDREMIRNLLQAGENNIITRNNGSWDGEEDTRDVYEDIINMILQLNKITYPKYLITSKEDTRHLYHMNSERITFASQIARLFNVSDSSFILESKYMPRNLVALYGIGKDNATNIYSVVLLNIGRRSAVDVNNGCLADWIYTDYGIKD